MFDLQIAETIFMTELLAIELLIVLLVGLAGYNVLLDKRLAKVSSGSAEREKRQVPADHNVKSRSASYSYEGVSLDRGTAVADSRTRQVTSVIKDRNDEVEIRCGSCGLSHSLLLMIPIQQGRPRTMPKTSIQVPPNWEKQGFEISVRCKSCKTTTKKRFLYKPEHSVV